MLWKICHTDEFIRVKSIRELKPSLTGGLYNLLQRWYEQGLRKKPGLRTAFSVNLELLKVMIQLIL